MASPTKKPRRPAGLRAERPQAASGSTRTSSRSAKRRSPKAAEPDPDLLEQERTEFLRAIDRYKRKSGKTFPTWTEVLDVIRSIGWVSPARMELDARERELPGR